VKMDGARFDSMARILAGRLSRRTALRGTGAGAAAGLFSALKLQMGRASVMRQDADLPYVVVRHYTPSASVSDLQQALGQYATQLAQQPGFIDYTVLSDDSGLTTINIFDSQDDEAAAANQLANWIDQNLASLLPDPDTDSSGTAIVHVASSSETCPTPPSSPTPTAAAATSTPASPPTPTAPTATAAAPTATALPVCTDPSRPGVGCTCTTGTQNPCGDTSLVCCPAPGAAPGAPGTCTPSSVGCEPEGPTPTPAPCTDIGCPCTAGVEGACDDGLVCCQSQMGGGDVPGGPGQCAAEDACGDGGAVEGTPVS
jgi:hypothetical protein